jgi:uncharacterized protein
MRVTVAYSPAAGEVDLSEIELPEGATLVDALRASGLFERHPQLQHSDQRFGIWGAKRKLDEPLRDGDRVEAWRPLQVDPKQARRLRQQQARAR